MKKKKKKGRYLYEKKRELELKIKVLRTRNYLIKEEFKDLVATNKKLANENSGLYKKNSIITNEHLKIRKQLTIIILIVFGLFIASFIPSVYFLSL